MIRVAPSILSADFTKLAAAVELIEHSRADWYHIDVMDGSFVPNITIGMPVIKALKKAAVKPFDVHLMIDAPERYVGDFKAAGADILCVHYEASAHLHRTVQLIRNAGMKPAVAINPHTSAALLQDIVPELYMVLVMSVNPGFGGQKFIRHSLDKVQQLRTMIADAGAEVLIEVDGGVNAENAPELIAAGADVLVAGNFVFGADDPAGAIDKLKSAG